MISYIDCSKQQNHFFIMTSCASISGRNKLWQTFLHTNQAHIHGQNFHTLSDLGYFLFNTNKAADQMRFFGISKKMMNQITSCQPILLMKLWTKVKWSCPSNQSHAFWSKFPHRELTDIFVTSMVSILPGSFENIL
jgi:hypothetical protein